MRSFQRLTKLVMVDKQIRRSNQQKTDLIMIFPKLIWYFLNIFFCIYNLNSLIENKLKTFVQYETVDLEDDYLSICLSIKSKELDCEQIVDDEIKLNACFKLRELFIFIENRTIKKSPFDILIRTNESDLNSYFELESNSSEVSAND